MTERLTRITLPGAKASKGLMDWGKLSTAEMVEQLRQHAAHLRAQAEEIETAADADFKVDLVEGVHRQRLIEAIQPGRSPTPPDL